MFKKQKIVYFGLSMGGVILLAGLSFIFVTNRETSSSPTTIIDPKYETSGVIVHSLMLPYSLDKLIETSDSIVLGTVESILPSEYGPSYDRSTQIIHTDVIVKVKSYLLGKPEYDTIAIRTLGGKTDDTAVIFGDGVQFTVGDNMVLYLDRLDIREGESPENISTQAVFRVIGGSQGKALLVDGIITHSTTGFEKLNLSDLSLRVATIRPLDAKQ
jgi:hypothetical protein